MRPTAKDVAKLSGVSIATVSNVITGKKYVSPDVAGRVRDAIQQLGYVPNATARNLRVNKSYRIAVLVPDTSMYFFGEIVKRIQAVAYEYHYQVVIANSNFSYEQELAQLQGFVNTGVDGVINVSPLVRKKDAARFSETPMVVVDRMDLHGEDRNFDYRNVGFVSADEREGARLVAQRCYATGFKKLVCLVHSDPLFTNTQTRCQYVCDYMRKRGVKDENILIQDSHLNFESGYHSLIKILDSGFDIQGSALFSSNDESAWGAMEALKERGYRIPQDVAVMGYDNAAFGNYVTPRLTTIDKPVKALGEMSANMLIDVLEGKRECLDHQRIMLRMSLMARDSM